MFQSQAGKECKGKLIAMGKEFAAELRIDEWDVVEWPPANVANSLVEVFAASTGCRSSQSFRKIAWELSGVDRPRSEVQRYVARYLS